MALRAVFSRTLRQPARLTRGLSAEVGVTVSEAETAALLKKAEGPWGELTVQNKVGIYRAIYKSTRAEQLAAQGGDTGQVVGGTIAGVCAGIGLFLTIHNTVITDTVPSTIQGEGWNARSNDEIIENTKKLGLNPMSGAGSEEWKKAYGK